MKGERVPESPVEVPKEFETTPANPPCVSLKMGDRFLSSAGAGGIVLGLGGCQTPAQYWIKIVHPWVQKFYPVLGLGSGERLVYFQTPVLYRINFGLREKQR